MALGETQKGAARRILDDPLNQRKTGREISRMLQDQAGLEQWRADGIGRRWDADKAQQEGSGLRDPSESLMNRALRTVIGVGAEAAGDVAAAKAMRAAGPFLPGIRALPGVAQESLGSMAFETGRQIFSRGSALNQGDISGALQEIGMTGVAPFPASRIGRSRLMSRANVGLSPERTRSLVSRLPGSSEAFLQTGGEELAEQVGRIGQATSLMTPFGETSGSLMRRATSEDVPRLLREGAQPPIPRRNLTVMVNRISDQLADAASEGFINNKPLSRFVERQLRQPALSTPAKLNVIRETLNDMLSGGAARRKPRLRGQIRALLAGTFRDIDQAALAGVPEAQALQQGLRIVRREKATDALLDYLDSRRVLSAPTPGDNTQLLRLNRVVDDLRRARSGVNPPQDLELLSVGLTRQEMDDLIDTAEMWNEMASARTAPRGTNVGSAQTLGTALLVGSIAGPQVGALAGGGRLILARAMATPEGRQVLRDAIRSGVNVNLADVGTQLVLQAARQRTPTPETISREMIQGLRRRFGPPRLEAP